MRLTPSAHPLRLQWNLHLCRHSRHPEDLDVTQESATIVFPHSLMPLQVKLPTAVPGTEIENVFSGKTLSLSLCIVSMNIQTYRHKSASTPQATPALIFAMLYGTCISDKQIRGMTCKIWVPKRGRRGEVVRHCEVLPTKVRAKFSKKTHHINVSLPSA